MDDTINAIENWLMQIASEIANQIVPKFTAFFFFSSPHPRSPIYSSINIFFLDPSRFPLVGISVCKTIFLEQA